MPKFSWNLNQLREKIRVVMMEKMVPPMSQSTSQKFDVQHNGLEEDCVSKLPDEILVSVLSLLTIKEAARTCVLSHRWKNLWQLVTGSLNFDASETIWEIMQEHRSLKVARFRYVGWVNRVLEFHRGSCVEEFRVCFDLNKRSQRYVDKWVRIAIAKRAERLELDFSPYFCDNPPVRYSFPEECVMSCKTVSGLPYIGLLKSLCLKYVNVSGYFLEYLISNCPLLERLSVAGSEDVQNLKVVGSSTKLKYLDISRCFSLKSVEIFAPNLVSFKYSGETIALNIGCAPELRDLSICGSFFHPITYAICAFSSYLSQLETLTLGFCIVEEDLELPQYPELTNLKQMTWRIHACDGRSLLGLTSLLEASPFLHTFKLELIWMEPRKQRRIKKAKAYPNENLKVVEVIGFVGHTIDIELALYLLETAPMLEKFVINPRRPCRLGRIWESKETDDSETIKKSAQLLEKNLPPGAKLIIL